MKGEDETVRINIGLKKELYNKLVEFSKQRGFLSVSEAVRYILVDYLRGEKQ